MTKEDIIKLAIEHTVSSLKFDEDGILRFAKLIAEHEREACAVICDEFPDAGHIGKRLTTNYHSYLIRNRGQA